MARSGNMNGLCEKCQVYYPMPDDFGQGAAYACPQCQSLLVPYEADAAPAQDEAAPTAEEAKPASDDEEPTAEVALPPHLAARDEDSPTDEVTLPPPQPTGPPPEPAPSSALDPDPDPEPDDEEEREPGVITQVSAVPEALKQWGAARQASTDAGGDPAPAPPPDLEALPTAEGTTPALPSPPPIVDGAGGDGPRAAQLFWFHPQVSPEVEAARARRADAAPAAPAEATPTPPPAEEESDAPSTYVMKGAGAGVAREELPLDPPAHKSAPTVTVDSEGEGKAPGEKQSPIPLGHQKGIARAAARPDRGGRGGLAAAAGVVFVAGSIGTWWALGMPGLGADTPAPPVVSDAVTADPDRTEAPDETDPVEGADAMDEAVAEAGDAADEAAAAAEAADANGAEPSADDPGTGAVAEAPPAPARQERTPPPAERKVAKATAPRPPPRREPRPDPPPRPTKTAPERQPPAETAKAPADPPPAPAEVARAETPPEAKADPPPADPPPPAEPSPRERAREHVREGGRLVQQGRHQEAIQEFERALLLDERNAHAHRGLGIAYASLGRVDEAARQYEVYLRLNPAAPDAERVRAIIEEYYASQQ